MQTPDYTHPTSILFFAILIVSLVAIPLNRTRIQKHWVWHFYKLPFGLYLVYELTMPAGVNIRADLVFLWPLLLFVLASRWIPLRNKPEQDKRSNPSLQRTAIRGYATSVRR